MLGDAENWEANISMTPVLQMGRGLTVTCREGSTILARGGSGLYARQGETPCYIGRSGGMPLYCDNRTIADSSAPVIYSHVVPP